MLRRCESQVLDRAEKLVTQNGIRNSWNTTHESDLSAGVESYVMSSSATPMMVLGPSEVSQR